MKQYQYPTSDTERELCKRPLFDSGSLEASVNTILNTVYQKKDAALFEYTKQFDGVALTKLQVSEKEIQQAEFQVPDDLKNAIKTAKRNIEKFHAAQIIQEPEIETSPGVFCKRKSLPTEKVGLYIPGGSAPLFSTVLMLAVPAQLAGCKEIVACSPPDKMGNLHPAILYSAKICGLSKIYKCGGAQAVAAMAYGTESIPKVYKIFGPGNQYVTKAKELVQQQGTAIDMPAGPSEVLIIADNTAKPQFIAADLLSQAEHGADSQAVLLSNSKEIIQKTFEEIYKQLEELPTKETARKSLSKSFTVLYENIDSCFDFSNRYAPEHLIIASENADDYENKVTSAGSVFMGNYSCESAGDYASGTNHTLPTNGYARNHSGVSVDSFVKKITFQKLTKQALIQLGETIEIMAESEGLYAHKNAVTLRLKYIKNV